MIRDKIKSAAALKNILAAFRNEGKKVVFTNGCFDILHYGHVKYLEDAKKHGDILIVAVNSDNSVRKIKGKNRPIVDEKNRMRVLAALESVDFVTLFNEATPLKIIRILKPDVLVKGGDWKKKNIVGSQIVQKKGGKVISLTLVKNNSTTNIIKKIGQDKD